MAALLPTRAPDPNEPIGNVRIGEQSFPVIAEKNWWLLWYNLVRNTLTGQGGGLPADALQDLAGADFDAADSNAIALRLPIRNLQVQQADELPPIPDPRIAQALMWAEDVLLPDPPARAQPVSNISPGGSPFTYTAPFAGVVAITGGSVSQITFVRQGTSVATGLTVGLFPVSRADQLTVTYSPSAPTMTFIPSSPA